MVKFNFVVVSGQEDYDYQDNVIEVVEMVEGSNNLDLSVMETIVDSLIGNKIPSGVPRIEGRISVNGDVTVSSTKVYGDNITRTTKQNVQWNPDDVVLDSIRTY